MLSDLAIDFIKSKYIKDILKEKKHQFTLEEQVSIIYHSDYTLEDKLEIFNKYGDINEIKDELHDNITMFIHNIILLIYEISNLIDDINTSGKYSIIYTNTNIGTTFCSNDINIVINRIKEMESSIDSQESFYTLDLYNNRNGNIEYTLLLNKEYKPFWYDNKTTEKNLLTTYFVNIPYIIEIGDTIITSDNKELVVVADQDSFSKFKEDTSYSDEIILAIPKNILDDEQNYKNQIEKIYKDRISNIENPYIKPDIIMENSIPVHIMDIVDVKKISKNS